MAESVAGRLFLPSVKGKKKTGRPHGCLILMRWSGGLPHSLPDVESINALQGTDAMQEKICVRVFFAINDRTPIPWLTSSTP